MDASVPPEIASHHVDIDGFDIHYLEAGEGPAVLLLHGWPTSSYLYRNIMPAIAKSRRVLAPDLIGFGTSDKPADASYTYRFHERMLEGFVTKLGIETTGLVVHDLGGPLGLYWAAHHRTRISELALLNTLIYPRPSLALLAFVAACQTPGLRSVLSSAWGLDFTMKIGVHDPACLSPGVVERVQEPFRTPDARKALIRSVTRLDPRASFDIARAMPEFRDIPVRVIYGEHDRILPDVDRTMRRVTKDLPHAQVTAIANCGHFLQEERPAEVARLLADFFTKS